MQIAADSLRCHEATGSPLLASSRTLGWTSLLLDHGVIPAGRTWEFETSATPDQTIVVMVAGEQRLQVFANGLWRTACYRAGTIGLTPSGRTDRVRRLALGQRADAEKINLYVPNDLMMEAGDEFRRVGRSPPDLNVLSSQDPVVLQLAFTLLKAASDGAPNLYADAAAHWLPVHLILRSWGSAGQDAARVAPEALSDRRLTRVLEFMAVHFAEPLTLDRLAREASISKFHFVRLFRDKVGSTPCAMLAGIRLDAARAMLAGTDLSISAIASRCGYRHASHLTVAFTRRFSVTPRRFRAAVLGGHDPSASS